jgi:hypothetical protein
MLENSGGRKGQGPPVVLDLGTGTGLLAMMAAQAGAPLVVGKPQDCGCSMHGHVTLNCCDSGGLYRSRGAAASWQPLF